MLKFSLNFPLFNFSSPANYIFYTLVSTISQTFLSSCIIFAFSSASPTHTKVMITITNQEKAKLSSNVLIWLRSAWLGVQQLHEKKTPERSDFFLLNILLSLKNLLVLIALCSCESFPFPEPPSAVLITVSSRCVCAPHNAL